MKANDNMSLRYIEEFISKTDFTVKWYDRTTQFKVFKKLSDKRPSLLNNTVISTI